MNTIEKKETMAIFPNSQPHIIRVSNISNEVIHNVSLFGAGLWREDFEWERGSMSFIKDNQIVVSVISDISGVTYYHLLNHTLINPTTIKKIYIECVKGEMSQLEERFNIHSIDASGSQIVRTIQPKYKDEQLNHSIMEVDVKFTLDGFTKLDINKIHPMTSFRMMLFPSLNESSEK